MDNQPLQPNLNNEDDSLEKAPTTPEIQEASGLAKPVSEQTPIGSTPINEPSTNTGGTNTSQKPPVKGARHLIKHFNTYVFALGLIVAMAVLVTVVVYLDSKSGPSTSDNAASESLTPSALQQLANNDTDIGSSGQVLNVASSAVFAGNVLARQALQVAGNLTVGGTLAINSLSVDGAAQFGQIQDNSNLNVAGESNLQGNLTVAKNLQVTGGGNFGGTVSASVITTSSLQLNGDLEITHHIVAGGTTPSYKSGPALGSGGTVSLSGSDTSGSISINTGAAPAAGCFINVTFSTAFSNTPHLIASPVGSAAGGLSYYVTRTSSGFSICDSTVPPADSSFGFDYIAID